MAPSLPSNCAQASVGADVVCSFGYTGAEQTFTVPAGVTSVTLTATGAGGGGDGLQTAVGLGGVATDTATVSAGETLYVEVGGQGASNTSGAQAAAPGGFNGGGSGGAGSPPDPGAPNTSGIGGAGGGGGSDVRTLPASDGLSPTDSRLVVGGGGGGGCDFSKGGNAGSPGGADPGGSGGGAGTLTGGGAGGFNGDPLGGTSGTLGAGGSGGSATDNPGEGYSGGCGGGGGFYGGGGGSYVASGGGGSSYAPGGTTGIAASAGNGSVTISFAPPPATALVLSPASATIPLGGSQAYSAVSVDAAGATLADVTAATTFSLPPGTGGPCGGLICRPTKAGTFVVTGTDGSLSGQAQLTESQGTPSVSLSVSPPSGVSAAAPVTLTATVSGQSGITPGGSVTFSESGAGSAVSCNSGSAVVSVTEGVATCDLGALAAGTYSFGAGYSGDTDYPAASAAGVTGYVVSPVPSQTGITSSVASPVFGQPVSFTATVSDSASVPVRGGSVQWRVDGTDSGGPVTVSSTGTAALGPLSGLAAGTHTIEADYSGTGTFAASSFQTTLVVGKAATATAVSATSSALTATVTTQAPGNGTPAGTVTFEVNGTEVGTAPLTASAAASQATATLKFASSGAHTVSASYGGGADFQPSSGSTATANPVITASVTSKDPKSRYGWYRAPVTVTFSCTSGSAPLAAPCPGPVTLSSNGAGQSVSKTITDTDGGMATVTVSPINIDTTKPKVTVTGAKNKASYQAPGPKLACRASDALSGLAGPCTLKLKRTETGVSWTAKATDKAGNLTTVSGAIKLTDFYIKGAKVSNGRYQVTDKKAFTVIAYLLTGKTPPRYVEATRAGVPPHPIGPKMTSIGNHLWEIRVKISTKMNRQTEDWTLGILAGKTLHIVKILLRR